MKTKTAKPECYGTMFPDLSKIEFNTPHEGKAFTVLVENRARVSASSRRRLRLQPTLDEIA